jgi:competence protein ComEC
MNWKLYTLLYLSLTAGILTFACLSFYQAPANLGARITMLDVGQGDSFLIQSKDGKQILIDGGRDSAVLSELAHTIPGDKSIDVVIATHPDADHIGGLSSVLTRYKVGLFLTSQVVGTSEVFKSLFESLSEKDIPAYYVRHGMSINLDESSKFTLLFPDRNTYMWETNTASVVGKFESGTSSALFMGDAPVSIELFLRATMPEQIDVDLLKLGHHGSKTSSSLEFLKATTPNIALISAGKGNRYKHPHQEVLDRLSQLGIPWVNTQNRGTVTFYATSSGWQEK